MDKNSNGGVKVSVTLSFVLKTEMTNFQNAKQKGKRIFILTATKDSYDFLYWS